MNQTTKHEPKQPSPQTDRGRDSNAGSRPLGPALPGIDMWSGDRWCTFKAGHALCKGWIAEAQRCQGESAAVSVLRAAPPPLCRSCLAGGLAVGALMYRCRPCQWCCAPGCHSVWVHRSRQNLLTTVARTPPTPVPRCCRGCSRPLCSVQRGGCKSTFDQHLLGDCCTEASGCLCCC